MPATAPRLVQTEEVAQEEATAEEAERVPILKAGDQKKLVKSLREYFEAKDKDRKVLDAQEEFTDLVTSLHKRLEPNALIKNMVDFEQACLLAGGDYKDNVKSKGKVVEQDFTGVWDDTIAYSVHAPKEYKVKDGPWPCVLVIPDGSVDLANSLQEEWVGSAMAKNAIVAVVGMPADPEAWNQWGEAGSDREPGTPGGIASTFQVLRELKSNYFIDPNRTILLGHGQGTAPTVDIAARFPHLFSSVVLISGDPGDTPAVNFSNLPTYIVSGGGGTTVFQDQIKELGYDNSVFESKVDMDAMWTWAMEHPRNPIPDRIVYSPLAKFAGTAYWLRVSGFSLEAGSQIEAKVDRANNLIEIAGEGFFDIEISYNDRLLDLDRPVRVVINGIEHESELKRSIVGMVNRFYNANDPMRLSVASATYAFKEAASE